MANQPVVHQIGRYIVSIEDDGICVFDPIIENNVYLSLSEADRINNGHEEELVPWLESKFSRKRSPRDMIDQPPSYRCR